MLWRAGVFSLLVHVGVVVLWARSSSRTPAPPPPVPVELEFRYRPPEARRALPSPVTPARAGGSSATSGRRNAKPPPLVHVPLALAETDEPAGVPISTPGGEGGDAGVASEPGGGQGDDSRGPPPPPPLRTEPRLAHLPVIAYPPAALSDELEGVVVMSIEVLADGSVGAVTVTSAPAASLAYAAEQGIRAARFVPAMVDGQPVSARLVYRYRFELR